MVGLTPEVPVLPISAGMAMLVTHISAATASLVWMIVEWRKTGKPGLVGIVTGTIAGLATITPLPEVWVHSVRS